ncbi:MAG: hypothetical protein AABY40_04360 [Nanoarchaeota archaeon]
MLSIFAVAFLFIVSCAPGEAVRTKGTGINAPVSQVSGQLVFVDQGELVEKGLSINQLFEKSGTEACQIMGYSGCEVAQHNVIRETHKSTDGSCSPRSPWEPIPWVESDENSKLVPCNELPYKTICLDAQEGSWPVEDRSAGSILSGVFCIK